MSAELPEFQKVLGEEYTLVRELGRGGMAVVWLAEDHRHERKVAIKVLREELWGSAHVHRFLREIRLEGRLQHPHILPIFDSGSKDGVLFYIMPYVEGETLRERLDREGMLPREDALKIAEEIAGALAYAHDKGILHRDIKPSNILLSNGHALVADFGVAKALQDSTPEALTQPGIAVGTPAYMSPEQAGGEGQLDPRSDLYALGCVLYEMLGGEPPFSGSSAKSVLAKQIQQPPPPLEVLRSDLPPALLGLVRRTLSKARADRPASAAAMSAELGRVGASDVSLSGPALVDRVFRRARRELPRLLVATVLILLLWIGFWPKAKDWALSARLSDGVVACFPFAPRAPESVPGRNASIALIRALEAAPSVSCVDTWRYLTREEQADPNRVGIDRAREVAVRVGAGFFLLGTTVSWSDSVSVALGLHRTVSGEEASQSSAKAGGGEATIEQIAVRALVGLLPPLLGAEEPPPDLSFMIERHPAAVAAWIEGEREYERLNFRSALELFSRSVSLDSLMAFAALKGAQAASWRHRDGLADSLVTLAVRHDSVLSPPERKVARGLKAYLDRDPVRAVDELEEALESEPEWAEVWTLVGEVHYHLLPQGTEGSRSAERAFKESVRLDASFHPPLIHLTEISLREGDTETAARQLSLLEETDAPGSTLRELKLMMRCVGEGPATIDWTEAVAVDVLAVLQAGHSLASGGSQPQCAEAAWRAVMEGGPYDRPSTDPIWGSATGLAGLFTAQGRISELESLLDDVRSSSSSRAAGAVPFLELLAATADPSLARRAWAVDTLAHRLFGAGYAGIFPTEGYAVATWHAAEGRVEPVRLIAIQAASDSTLLTTRGNLMKIRAIQAHRDLLQGDTAEAVAAMEALLAQPGPSDLAWSWDASLPFTRLTLAEVHLKRNRWERALEVASQFDHPEPAAFLFFLPRSLVIRAEASEALGRPQRAGLYRQRLGSLRGSPVGDGSRDRYSP